MTGSGRTSFPVASLGAIGPVLLSTLALCALGGSHAIAEALVAVAAFAGSLLLRGTGAGDRGVLWIVPAALAIGGTAALSGASLTSEFLAAIAGLSLLFWVGVAPASDRPAVLRSGSGLLLPGAAVLLALLVTEVLPGGPSRLGLASALLVVVLLAFGWAIRSDRTAPTDAAAGS